MKKGKYKLNKCQVRCKCNILGIFHHPVSDENASNQQEETLELIVVKAPAPKG